LANKGDTPEGYEERPPEVQEGTSLAGPTLAIDSVPAVLSVSQTAFVAYSSIVFAVLGLRAHYFALEGLVDRFVYLHYGLAVILVFVGAKFVAQGFGV
jgi:tellurite resistance protein TerC